MPRNTKAILAFASLVASVCAANSESAIAQTTFQPDENEASANNRRSLETVVVTATRREELQQSTPVAITTFTGEKLKAMSIADTGQLGDATPGLQITPSGGGKPFSPQVSIRGQVQNAINITNDPSVGLYIDDIYIGKDSGSVTDLIDVERVEVLKGPQGTLFGRNTTGGAIVYVSNQPKLNETSGSIRAGYGNHNQYSAQLIANLPINNWMAARVAGSVRGHDGYTQTIFGDVTENGIAVDRIEDTNQLESITMRGILLAEPNDRLSLSLNASFHDKAAPTGVLNHALAGDLPSGMASPLLAQSPEHLNDFFSGYQSASDGFGNRLDYRNEADGWRISGRADYEVSEASYLKAIIGYLESNTVDLFDVDGTVLPFANSLNIQEFEQFSAEVQFGGRALNDTIDYLTGLYYFSEQGRDVTNSAFVFGPPAGQVTEGFGENVSYSAFGHVKYKIDDNSTLQGGIRFTLDEKDYRSNVLIRQTTDEGVVELCILVPSDTTTNNGSDCIIDPSQDEFDFISYSLGIDREFMDDKFIYLRTSRGQRSGGQQNRPIEGAFPAFEEEVLTDFEIGTKLDFANMFRLNLAYFWGDYEDIQFATQVPTAIGTTTVITQNTGAANVQGFEAEANLVLPAGFGLDTGYSYNKIDYADADRQQFLIPETTFNVSGTYSRTIGNKSIQAQIDYFWRDKINKSELISTTNPIFEGLETYERLNARLSLSFEDGFEVAVYGRNLNNNQSYPDLLNFANFVEVGYTGSPALYGIEFGYRF